MKQILKVGSFFAGVGGLCLGLEQAENPHYAFDVVWANEIDKYACATYRHNFTSTTLLEGDVNWVLHPDKSDNPPHYQKLKDIMLGEPIDLLNGGFPCQSFSIAGERKGFADERGNLFLSFIDFILMHEKKFHTKPRFLLFENVKNLKTHDKGRTYQIIRGKLEKLGYFVDELIVNTAELTYLPQNRERIYILGFANQSDFDKFDSDRFLREHNTTKTKAEKSSAIRKIIDRDRLDERFYYTKEKYPHYFNENDVNLASEIKDEGEFYQLRRGMYVRKNQSGLCPTLTANMGTGGHNVPLVYVDGRIRKLTPVETFRLQGFPVGEGYSLPTKMGTRKYPDSQLYKQAGNAVSVPVVKLIAEAILELLSSALLTSINMFSS